MIVVAVNSPATRPNASAVTIRQLLVTLWSFRYDAAVGQGKSRSLSHRNSR